MDQRLQRHLAVGENVGTPGHALIGGDIDQHQWRCLEDAEGVLEQPLERHDDRACFHAANLRRGSWHGSFPQLTLYKRRSRGAVQSVPTDSSRKRPAYSARNATRWVCPGSTASVSSQNGFQPSSSRSSNLK